MAYVDVNGLSTYYEVHGDGAPLMLLHGGFGNAPSMAPMTDVLSRQFTVYLPERRGHGHTGDAGVISYELMAEDTAGFMKAVGIERAHIVGYSDGGIICLYMGMRYPDLVDHLIPISANFHWNGLTENMRVIFEKSTPETLAMVIPDEVVYHKANSPDGPNHFPTVFAKMQQLFLTEPNLSTDNLAAIKAPTLVLAADRDLMTIEHTVDLHKAVGASQLCVVPGANHSLVFDRADDVNAAVTRFLAS